MGKRLDRPEPVRLDLTDGCFILVKPYLTHGEDQSALGRVYKGYNSGPRGTLDLEITKARSSYAAEYLLAIGGYEDVEGNPISLEGLSTDDKMTLLGSLPKSWTDEMLDAIDQHVKAQDDQRSAEKNAQDGGSNSKPTLRSAVP